MTWLNQKRIRDYPRLIGISIWGVMILNIITHKGWFGGFGGIISFDFVAMVAAARLYWIDIKNFYQSEALFIVERQLFFPTPLEGGGNIYTYPPYVALPYSIFLSIPYTWSFILWTGISILALVVAVYWMSKYLVSAKLKESGSTNFQLQILTFSSLPVVFGLLLGQNSAISLLLIVGVVILVLKDRWYLAGATAGLLLYKPHFCLAFLILWLVWRQYKAILAFSGVACIWIGGVLVTQGLGPFQQYLQVLPELMHSPYGIGRYLEVTLFSLLATSLPMEFLPGLLKVLQGIIIISTLSLACVAYCTRKGSSDDKIPALILGLLFPFIAAPHTLVYDLILLIPAFVLWGKVSTTRSPLYAAVIVYLGSFFLILLSRPTGVALLALLPLTLLVFFIQDQI